MCVINHSNHLSAHGRQTKGVPLGLKACVMKHLATSVPAALRERCS
jgi:hypothetical protein